MADRINELRQKHLDAKASFKAMLDAHLGTATAAGRGFTKDEKDAQAVAEAAATAAGELFAAEERRLALDDADAGKRKPRIAVDAPNHAKDPRRGFQSHREFLLATIMDSGHRERSQVQDERLRPLAVADKDDKRAAGELAYMLPVAFTPRYLSAVGSDEHSTVDDRFGGLSVQTTRLPGVMQLQMEGDPTAGRTMAIPMQSPSVEIEARVDKDHSTSVTGGFIVTRKAEMAAAGASRQQNELITLKASSLFGLSFTAEELLQDSPLSYVAIIETGFRDQMATHMLNEKLRGGGGNEYLGILNAANPAVITVGKEAGQANDTIVGRNAINMAARCYGFGNAIWIANHDTRPQLYEASIPVGTGGVLLYQPSRQEGFPDMLLGRPVFYSEHASKLGDKGDLILGDWRQYLDGLYQPFMTAESVHVRFVNHERAFKAWTRNAGAPWWKSPLTPAQSAATLAPFVVLAAR